MDLEYIMKFKLTLEWYDYRLTYWNLKSRRSANRFSEQEFDRWDPKQGQSSQNTKFVCI